MLICTCTRNMFTNVGSKMLSVYLYFSATIHWVKIPLKKCIWLIVLVKKGWRRNLFSSTRSFREYELLYISSWKTIRKEYLLCVYIAIIGLDIWCCKECLTHLITSFIVFILLLCNAFLLFFLSSYRLLIISNSLFNCSNFLLS